MSETQKHRVLIIIPSLRGGGAERVLLNFLEKADYSRFAITLVVISFTGVYKNQVPSAVKVIPLFRFVLLERIMSYLHKRFNFKLIYRIMVKRKIPEAFDTSVSYQDSNYTELLFFIRNPGYKICWVHSSLRSNPNYQKYLRNRGYRERIERTRYARVDEIVFVSESSMNDFKKIYSVNKPLRVVNNVLNSEQIIKKSKQAVEFGKGSFTFIAVGNLLPVKGYDRLVRAAVILKEKGLEFEILIIGEGVSRKNLTEMINDRGLQASVKLMGFQRNPYPYMRLADAFVMTSVSEAMPTALCEAFILGKPVVVTRCEACEEYTSNGEYALMAEQDDVSLADRMTEMITDSGLLADLRRQSIARGKKFDDEKVLDDYHRVIRAGSL